MWRPRTRRRITSRILGATGLENNGPISERPPTYSSAAPYGAREWPRRVSAGTRIERPSMEGDVKAHLADLPRHVAVTSGVHLQSRRAVAACERRGHVAASAVHRGGVERAVFVASVFDHRSSDIEAVVFSRECGNHPSIRASACHVLLRLSGGHSLSVGTGAHRRVIVRRSSSSKPMDALLRLRLVL